MRAGFAILFCLMLAGPAVQADKIYKTEDEQGRTVYTDRPSKTTREQTELPPVNDMSTPEQDSNFEPESDTEQENEDEPIEYGVQIIQPANETTLTAGERDLQIRVELTPNLQNGHSLAYYLDNELVQQTPSTQLVIEEIFRGRHSLSVNVVDQRGRTLGRSQPVVVFVHRPSRLLPPNS